MEFIHKEDIQFEELTAVTKPSGRVYTTPDGDYPSVTTVLGYFKKAGIIAWRKRVGDKEANRISGQASVRGTKVHQLAEDYINNVKNYKEDHQPANIDMFENQLKPVLDKHLGLVYGVEVPLYSSYLKLAGRCDLVGEWDGRKAIIDFKTSRKLKKEEWIEDYFMQGACYSVMFEERTGIAVNDIVILIGVDGEVEPQLFVKKRDDYIDLAIHKVREYEKIHSQRL
jgi:hypothetical protein